MGLGEASDDLRHIPVCVVVRSADPKRALQPIVVEGGNRLVVQADHTPGIVQQLLALGSQPVAASVLGKKLFADPLLQPPHLHGHGGLRLEDPVGRLGEASGVDNGEERSEEHTSELQSLMRISYAVFCLKKKIINM